MSETVGKREILKIIENVAETVIDNEKKLTELDSKIGDGDHGVNLKQGFSSVLEKLSDLEEIEDIGAIMEEIGSTVMESTGGSVGILYGSAIKRMGEAVEGKKEIGTEKVVGMCKAADEAIKKRGQVEVGEKTMYDAIHPCAETIAESVEEGLSLKESLSKGVESAKEGLGKTKEMEAKKGRAKYFGEKTIGHKDVGAFSSYLMIKSAVETLKSEI